MGVNSLPKTVTRQRHDCDLNPGPSAPESSTLTTRGYRATRATNVGPTHSEQTQDPNENRHLCRRGLRCDSCIVSAVQ